MMTRITVLATGPQALIEDAGRPGLAAMGVGSSGAADRASFALANRLVGNPEGAAVVEALLGGLALRADHDLDVAVTGASVSVNIDAGDGPVPMGLASRHRLRAGEVLSLGYAEAGLRAYLAVRGGLDVAAVLGSRSTDTLSGIGPAPLRAGDVLAVGEPSLPTPIADQAPVAAITGDEPTLRLSPGPRPDWLVDVGRLVGAGWTVTDDVDRVGIRLRPHDGPGVELVDPTRQLPSEPTVRGAVQIPPDGAPVLFGADHPVTGGYPVVAVLSDAASDRAAQLRPGQRLRFTWA